MIEPDKLRKQLESLYQKIGIFDFRVAYIYSDLRELAAQLNPETSRDDLFNSITRPLLDNGMTIIVPTFTYTTSGTFEVSQTRTRLGAMNKWILSQKAAHRSEHPLFSDAALGPESDLVENVGKSAFGTESVFDRLKNRDCGFLHLGHDLTERGNTVIHHVEQVCGATYRFHKAFHTKVYRLGEYVGTDYTAFLRRLDVPDHDFVTNFRRGASIMKNRNMLRESKDLNYVCSATAYGFDESVELLSQLIYKDPSFFIDKEFIQY